MRESLLFLITILESVQPFLFPNLFGSSCNCPTQCEAPAPMRQPCQIFCPPPAQSCSSGGGYGSSMQSYGPSYSSNYGGQYQSPSAYPQAQAPPQALPQFPAQQPGYGRGVYGQRPIFQPQPQPLPAPPQQSYQQPPPIVSPVAAPVPQYNQSPQLVPAPSPIGSGYQTEVSQSLPEPQPELSQGVGSTGGQASQSYVDQSQNTESFGNNEMSSNGVGNGGGASYAEAQQQPQSEQDQAPQYNQPFADEQSPEYSDELDHEGAYQASRNDRASQPILSSMKVLSRGEGHSGASENYELALKQATVNELDRELSDTRPQRSSEASDQRRKSSEGISIPKSVPNYENGERLQRNAGKSKYTAKITKSMKNFRDEFDIYEDLVGTQQATEENLEPLAQNNSAFPLPQSKRETSFESSFFDKPQKKPKKGIVKCNSEKLRRIMNERMSASPSTSKQMIYSGVREEFDDRSPDVICSRASFSYIVVTSPEYCEHRKAPVTCFVYFQP